MSGLLQHSSNCLRFQIEVGLSKTGRSRRAGEVVTGVTEALQRWPTFMKPGTMSI